MAAIGASRARTTAPSSLAPIPSHAQTLQAPRSRLAPAPARQPHITYIEGLHNDVFSLETSKRSSYNYPRWIFADAEIRGGEKMHQLGWTSPLLKAVHEDYPQGNCRWRATFSRATLILGYIILSFNMLGYLVLGLHFLPHLAVKPAMPSQSHKYTRASAFPGPLPVSYPLHASSLSLHASHLLPLAMPEVFVSTNVAPAARALENITLNNTLGLI